jgi:hypothetical protein
MWKYLIPAGLGAWYWLKKRKANASSGVAERETYPREQPSEPRHHEHTHAGCHGHHGHHH